MGNTRSAVPAAPRASTHGVVPGVNKTGGKNKVQGAGNVSIAGGKGDMSIASGNDFSRRTQIDASKNANVTGDVTIGSGNTRGDININ